MFGRYLYSATSKFSKNCNLASTVAPRAELLALRGEECHPVDVERRGAALYPDDVVVLQEDRLPLDLVLEHVVDSAVHDVALSRISNVKGPDETLINDLDRRRELLDVLVGEERALVDVAERSGLASRSRKCHRRRLWRLSEENLWRFRCRQLDCRHDRWWPWRSRG